MSEDEKKRRNLFARTQAARDQMWAQADAGLEKIQGVAMAVHRGAELTPLDLEVVRKVLFLVTAELYARSADRREVGLADDDAHPEGIS